MTYYIQQLKFMLVPQLPWEVDFRDTTVVVQSDNRSIKVYSTIGLCVIAAILGLWCALNFFGAQTQKHRLKDAQDYVAQNTTKQKKLMEENKKFVEKKDLLMNMIKTYKTSIDVSLFLQDLMHLKTAYLRFSTIIIQDTKNIASGNLQKSFQVELFGSLNDDVDYLEKYKDDLIKINALQPMQGKFKSFYKIDRSKTTDNEIQFQLTIQSNEQ